MNPRRLLKLWEPPPNHRLASAIATTYELQADFLEEDLLPIALDLRSPPAQGRDFRLELEKALQDTEITVFFNPSRYQPGLRRSPRVDLVPLPEGRFPKLHAKIALLRFIPTSSSKPHEQIVRLIVASANLTTPGYRSNIEVAAAVDDGPKCPAENATVVRDAVAWLETLVGASTEQAARQFRDIKAVFSNRSVQEVRNEFRFVGLPTPGGLPAQMKALGTDGFSRLTIASPFWPTGDNLSDVAVALRTLGGNQLQSVRLIGPALIDDAGKIHPVMPPALISALMKSGLSVSVAAADPSYDCKYGEADEETEFDQVANRRGASPVGSRQLHAKMIVAEGSKSISLAVGSFNLTRRGLGLISGANAEAGLLWVVPKSKSEVVDGLVSFATNWQIIDRAPDDIVVKPKPSEEENLGWPTFLLSLRARRSALVIEGDAQLWPATVTVRMRDIRSRLLGEEQWFDTLTIERPQEASPTFTVIANLDASWIATKPDVKGWPVLPDLEAEITWQDGSAIVPVVFEEKHLFPIVESKARDDEQALIAWFLGLRPSGPTEGDGFSHSIDPIKAPPNPPSPTLDILSYLVRDFVHALPGIRSRLAEAGVTETGLRTALLGPRSPVELAREALRSLKVKEPSKPRKTAVATAFQLKELQHLLETVPLPELADGAADTLRKQAILEVAGLLETTLKALPAADVDSVANSYWQASGERP